MNFCPNCGKEIKSTAKFCASCGQEVKTEQTAAATEIVQPTTPTKAPFALPKKWIIIALIAAVVIGGSSVLAINLLKGPKELYLLSELKSYQNAMEQYEEQYGEDIKFQEAMLEGPSSSELRLSGNLEIETEYEDPSLEMIQEILDQASIVVKSDQDPKNQASYNTLSLEMDGANAVDVELVQTSEQLGLRIPILFDQYFYMNLDEYGDFMRMVDPYYVGPEKLDLEGIKWEDLKLTEKEQDALKKRYSAFLLDELKDEYFTLEKNVEFEDMKVREITLEMSPDEVKSLLTSFIDELIEDKELQSIIADRVVTIAKSVDETDKELTNKSKVEKELTSGLKDMKKELRNVEVAGFTSVIQIDKKEQIVGRQMEMTFNNGLDDFHVAMTTKNVPKGNDERLQELKVELLPEDEELGKMQFELSNEIKEESKERNEELVASFYFEEYGYVSADISFAMDSTFKGKDPNKQTVEREFDLNMSGDSFYDMMPISGTITQKKDISVKDKYSKNAFEIEVNVEDEYEPGTIFVNVESESKLKNKIDLPKLDTDSGQNIADLTEEDFYYIYEEIGYNIQQLMDEYNLNYY
ncbi:zinc-ribbon domain-containing protein [Fredinandcohnia humi]